MPVSEQKETHDNDEPDRLPTMAKLRTALSNPNLLDIEEKVRNKTISFWSVYMCACVWELKKQFS